MSRPKKFYRAMTPERAVGVRHMYFVQKYRQGQIARLLKISQSAVSRIVRGITWNHL